MNNIPLNDYLLAHCNDSMERALAAERHPAWQRSCPEMNDIDFLRLGLLRCISAVDSGRHFLQTTEEIHGELLPHSTYFKALKSPRRASMLDAIERQSYKIHSEHLAAHGIDYPYVLRETLMVLTEILSKLAIKVNALIICE